MENLKAGVYQLCLAFIRQRIETAETALAQAQEASNDDTKSSAGDKFETTREMMQQDISRNKGLLADAKQNLQLLNSLEDAPLGVSVRNGSLVYTSAGIFYISIPAGQLTYKDQQVFAISASSPIGQLFFGKKAGDLVSFNKKDYTIKEVL
ncbi:GreA/GreB family elongation factor [Pedobacter sp. MC2016-14]|uniref:GreA/GreB family elongation factor n=1 Tax=Pedobacter sp. MC2016-14 TaxID=2897327 RepID=UPI001E5EEDD4|nr:GreA/GreB family elongation factor [Pedobacter sp. MC2016-14]MCD0489428.1 GreA/GreB family elongation factor [Pedobacter sp. MC2016-14]